MPDQYTRTRAQLGTPALDALRKAHVAETSRVWHHKHIMTKCKGDSLAWHFIIDLMTK